MGKTTGIKWTDHTFNPWIGCTRVSPACDFCYAATSAERKHWVTWGTRQPRKLVSADTWKNPHRFNRKAEQAGERRRVFCASMADVFDAEAPESELPKVWALIRETPWLDWQLLTKRPNRIRKVLPPDLHGAPNVWLGTSVESSDQVWRIGELLETDAVVHFLSVEPLLGPIPTLPLQDIEWVIVGGESASTPDRYLVSKSKAGWEPTATGLAWVRAIRDQCVTAGVPFFFKQWGGSLSRSGGRTLDGREWDELPTILIANKNWPEHPAR